MRFCLDARSCTNHFPGISRYVSSLAVALASLMDSKDEMLLLISPEHLLNRELPAASDRVFHVRCNESPFSLQQQWRIPHLLKKWQVQLYHSPYYLMPYRLGCPSVVTISDLIPWILPHCVSWKARLFFGLNIRMAIKAADQIIVISKSTEKDLARYYRYGSLPVRVIHLAADSSFRPVNIPEIEQVRRLYCLPEEYIFYLGSGKSHKNIDQLLVAWRQINSQPPLALVIAGPLTDCLQEKQHLFAKGDNKEIYFPGAIAEQHLPGLYSGAKLFVFPSLYEGFGLPVLEAMACNTPVICSHVSSLPEVGGMATVTFNPSDPNDIAAVIKKTIGNEDLLQDMRNKGQEQVKKFTWLKTARETLDVYRSTIAARKRGIKKI